jgi:hypothetical protein
MRSINRRFCQTMLNPGPGWTAARQRARSPALCDQTLIICIAAAGSSRVAASRASDTFIGTAAAQQGDAGHPLAQARATSSAISDPMLWPTSSQRGWPAGQRRGDAIRD